MLFSCSGDGGRFSGSTSSLVFFTLRFNLEGFLRFALILGTWERTEFEILQIQRLEISSDGKAGEFVKASMSRDVLVSKVSRTREQD